MYTLYTMSNRGRLSRERILEDALQIVDAEGLDGLTIRRLAQELGVTPMAVYRHFENKDAILHGLIELVILEGAAIAHETEGWRAWTEETFFRIRASLLRHPGVLPLLGSTASYGLESLRITERLLGAFREGGLSDDETARALHVLISYTLGAVAIEVAAREGGSDDPKTTAQRQRALQSRFEGADVTSFPHLVSLAPRLARFVEDEEFRAGLHRIIATLVSDS